MFNRCFETQSSPGCTCTRRSKILTHSLTKQVTKCSSSRIFSHLPKKCPPTRENRYASFLRLCACCCRGLQPGRTTQLVVLQGVKWKKKHVHRSSSYLKVYHLLYMDVTAEFRAWILLVGVHRHYGQNCQVSSIMRVQIKIIFWLEINSFLLPIKFDLYLYSQ